MTISDLRNYILEALERSESYNPGLANKAGVHLTVSNAIEFAFRHFGLESEYVERSTTGGRTVISLYFTEAPAAKELYPDKLELDVYISVIDVHFQNPKSLVITLDEHLEKQINRDGTIYNEMVTDASNLSQIFYAFEAEVLVQITEGEVAKYDAERLGETLAIKYGLTDDKLEDFARDRLDNDKTLSWYKEAKVFLDFLNSINEELPFIVKQGAMDLQHIWRNTYFNAILQHIIGNYSMRDLAIFYNIKE